MPRALRNVLIAFAACIALAVAGMVAFGVWLRNAAPEIRKVSAQMSERGAELGCNASAQECLDEGHRQADACESFACETGVAGFVTACLEQAAVPPEFCDDVPPQSAMFESIVYRTGKCDEVTTSQQCNQVLAAVQNYCNPPEQGNTPQR